MRSALRASLFVLCLLSAPIVYGQAITGGSGSGSGLPAGCTSGTNPLIYCTQAANGNDTINESRFTDTTPTGTFLNFLNAAKNAALYSVDVLGNATAASYTATGTCFAGTAGCFAISQGTAPTSLPVNSIVYHAPASVTSYHSIAPGASLTGFLFGTNSTDGNGLVTNTQSFLADPLVVAHGGTGLASGTSGGILCFTAATTMGSSAALTVNLPVIGGGAGVCPGSGTATGNTTQFATWTGATTSARCIDTDTNGNLKVTAADCSAGTNGNSVANVTAVTATNPSAEAVLQELSIGAGFLNVLRQPFLIRGAGFYTTAAAQTPTLRFRVKLCTVSGCGSGTVVTLFDLTSTASTASQTNDNWHIDIVAVTNATGATGNLKVHGPLSVDLGAATTSADTVFVDTNTATSANIDLTAALFIDFTVLMSSSNASNAVTEDASMIAPQVASNPGSASPSAPNYGQGFTNQTSITLLGTSHNLNNRNLIVSCYDTASPANAIQPASWTVNGSTFDVIVTFATSQSGYCVVNGSGPAFYATTFTNQTAVTVNGTTHGLNTADLNVAVYDSATGTRNRIEPASVSIDSASFNVSVTFAVSQSGRIVITD